MNSWRSDCLCLPSAGIRSTTPGLYFYIVLGRLVFFFLHERGLLWEKGTKGDDGDKGRKENKRVLVF